MSFQNYDGFQGQQPTEQTDAPGAAGVQPQQPQMGPPMDASAGPFHGGNMVAPGGAGSEMPEGVQKNTLW